MADCCLALLPLRNSVRGRVIFIDYISDAVAGCVETGFTPVLRGFIGVFNDDLLEFVNGICSVSRLRLLHSVRIKFDLILIGLGVISLIFSINLNFI